MSDSRLFDHITDLAVLADDAKAESRGGIDSRENQKTRLFLIRFFLIFNSSKLQV